MSLAMETLFERFVVLHNRGTKSCSTPYPVLSQTELIVSETITTRHTKL